MRAAIALSIGVFACVLASAAPASAVVYTGFTWYSDGAFYREGPSGTVIRLYATGAIPNRTYKLYSSPFIPERDHELCGYSLTELNPNPRTANSSGLIGQTAGALTGPPGDYMICFVDPSDPFGYRATVYAHFRIRS